MNTLSSFKLLWIMFALAFGIPAPLSQPMAPDHTEQGDRSLMAPAPSPDADYPGAPEERVLEPGNNAQKPAGNAQWSLLNKAIGNDDSGAKVVVGWDFPDNYVSNPLLFWNFATGSSSANGATVWVHARQYITGGDGSVAITVTLTDASFGTHVIYPPDVIPTNGDWIWLAFPVNFSVSNWSQMHASLVVSSGMTTLSYVEVDCVGVTAE